MIQYNTVEEALEALRKGHIIMVTDDADRENGILSVRQSLPPRRILTLWRLTEKV